MVHINSYASIAKTDFNRGNAIEIAPNHFTSPASINIQVEFLDERKKR